MVLEQLDTVLHWSNMDIATVDGRSHGSKGSWKEHWVLKILVPGHENRLGGEHGEGKGFMGNTDKPILKGEGRFTMPAGRISSLSSKGRMERVTMLYWGFMGTLTGPSSRGRAGRSLCPSWCLEQDMMIP